MKSHLKRRLFACIELMLLIAFVAQLQPGFSVTPAQENSASAANQLAALPLAFEPNLGQTDPSVQYLVHQGKATTYFTPTDTVVAIGADHLTIHLDDANTSPSFSGTDELSSKTNYFTSNDPTKWQRNVPNYQKLNIANIYPGIDVEYYGNNQHSLEHDFIVAPGADPKQISMNFDGQRDLSLDRNGTLTLKLASINLELHAPITYQNINGTRHTIESRYIVDSDNGVTIALGDYDHTATLVIDPVVSILYATYLGGGGIDGGFNTAIDASGTYQYINGITDSSDFPISGGVQGSLGGGQDVFVSMLSGDGSGLIYSTYLGGGGTEVAGNEGLAVDAGGNAYITGSTNSTDFPVLNEYQSSNAGLNDAFVAKIDASGSTLIYSTYLGGSSDEETNGSGGIAVDGSNQAYVTGLTDSTDFPVLNEYQSSNAGSSDTFVTKFDAFGSALLYSTYLGGSSFDQGMALALDTSNNVYITGLTGSSDFPISNAFQSTINGVDSFITKIDNTGTTIIYSTFIGGSGLELTRSIAVDSSGQAYVTGVTASSNLPTNSPYQSGNAGGFTDVFVSKLSSSGSALIYSTYLGGSGQDGVLSIAIDSGGYAYVTGFTDSTDFPTLLPFQLTNGGGQDIFVTKFNPSGSTLAYSTYIGGSGDDGGGGVAVNASGDAFVAGGTNATDFPVTGGSYQGGNAGSYDAVALKIASLGNLFVTVAPILTFAVSPTSCNIGHFSTSETKFCTHLIAAATNATNGYTISYIPTTTLTSGANTIDAMTSQTASVLGIEQFGFNLKANTAAGSFTATDFGADPSGGSGFALTDYNTADQFKFLLAGDNIAQSTIASNLTTFNASYIVNIAGASEAGFYSTPITYAIAPSY